MHEPESIDTGLGRHVQRVDAERMPPAHAERGAARDEHQLLAVCAHELRNPLASLQCNIDALRGCCSSPALEPHLDMMDWQTRKLARIVDDLLELARVEQRKIELHKERVDVGVVVARAVESTRHLIEARRQQLSVAQPGALHVLADPLRLEQVLVNLLVNAAKYTDLGGCIAVAVERDTDAVRLCVRDSGIGMNAEELARAFELFAQSSGDPAREQGGLGVGLALVKQLVEQHGGRVHASSEGRGRGSEFVVRLPLAREPAARRTDGARRVLVVDDNRDVADALVRLIGHLGHSAHAVPDGPSALAIAAVWAPDVVLLDIGLPFMDGYAVARELSRGGHEDAPLLVALTGYGHDEVGARARAAGFAAHMVKPPRVAALAELLGAPRPAPT